MALTATAQSAIPPNHGHAWEDVIVPTLRKRLRDESTMLAKRISAASIVSGDDHSSDYQYHNNTFPTASTQSQKPSAIPRPSLQHSTTGRDSPQTSPSPAFHFQRSRTHSQPFLFDDFGAAASNGTSSRPTSPMANGTRIPVSRARTGSTSTTSHAQGSIHGSTGRSDGYSMGRSEQPELSPVDERDTQHHSTRSTVRTPRTGGAHILNEQPPFTYDSPRVSSDSEERPYEHWYRGDVSRNGGVGELRVGRRDEMLDIASYGHSFRDVKAPSRAGISTYSRSRSNSRGRDVGSRTSVRHRADSVGARESVYIDEDQEESMVLDQQPPTDFESDGYAEQEELYDMYQDQDVQPHPNGTMSSPSLLLNREQSKIPSRIPTPSRHVSPPPRTPSPRAPIRSVSEASTSSNAANARSRTVSQPKKPPLSMKTQNLASPSSPANKRRAKSPATPSSTNSNKRAKSKPPPSSMRKELGRKEEDRRSIGQYPTPEGEDMVDAIPTWTQPVPASGNWDDVILPVVARKKGLDGHYVTTDGSPKPKPASNMYEPAPGTFGFDHTKARGAGAERAAEDIPMSEFGQRNDEEQPRQQQPQPTPPLQSPLSPVVDDNRSRTRPSPAPSPPPFAHYAETTINAPTSLHLAEQRQEDKHDDDVGGDGCCKCLVM